MKVTIKDIVDFYTTHPECIGEIKVDTRFGYKTIEYADVTAYNSEILQLKTETGKKIKCSPDHLFYDGSTWKSCKEYKIGDFIQTFSGIEKVIKNELLSYKEDLYDLQVEDVHEFYANGIVSHNSLLTDGISYVLFGKPYRNINKPQLINSINGKGCLVEIFFKRGDDEYIIERGMKPNVFNIHKNGVLMNQDAAIKDYQSYLEKNILCMNYRTFKQMIILSSSTFVSFMQLNTAEKRAVVENLLDISIFSKMNVLLKERYKVIKESKKSIEPRIESVKSKMTLKSKHIKEISENHQDKIHFCNSKIERLMSEVKTLNESIALWEAEIKEKKNTIAQLTDAQDYEKIKEDISSKVSFLKSYINDKEKYIKFFVEHDNCPTCTQKIPEELKEQKKNSLTQDKEKKEQSLTQLSILMDKTNSVLAEVKKITDEIWSVYQQVSNGKNSIISLERQISEERDYKKKLESESKENVGNHIEELKEYKTEYMLLSKELDELSKSVKNYEQCIKILDDSGIKSKVIKQYIPLMNKLMNEYLRSMDFHVHFHLDEEFNETIKSAHRDNFSYDSFSEGEKARIDLALLFTWKEICRIRNSVNSNLIVFDEVFDGSLDSDARESLLQILETLQKTNVFVITHHPDVLYDKFHSHIEIHKKNGFTKIKG